MRAIPLLEPVVGQEENDAVSKAIASGYFNEGNYCREFEKEFGKFVKAKYCHLVPNGRIALYMSLLLSKNSSFFVPSHYGIFAAQAVREVKGISLPIDVNSEGVIGIGGFNEIAVHANGRKAALGGEMIEDSCQAISLHTQNAISSYSFHSSKVITCGGIGGAVCVDDKDLYEKLGAIKDHGRPDRYQGKRVSEVHLYWGSNFKMSEINAAFGLAQLKKLPERIRRFNKIYDTYKEILGNKVEWFEQRPAWRVDCKVPDAAIAAERLKRAGVMAQQYYLPLHLQPVYFREHEGFPNSDRLFQKGLYLPSTTTLTDEDIQFVCQEVLRAVS